MEERSDKERPEEKAKEGEQRRGRLEGCERGKEGERISSLPRDPFRRLCWKIEKGNVDREGERGNRKGK